MIAKGILKKIIKESIHTGLPDRKNILNNSFKHKIPYKFDKDEMYDK